MHQPEDNNVMPLMSYERMNKLLLQIASVKQTLTFSVASGSVFQMVRYCFQGPGDAGSCCSLIRQPESLCTCACMRSFNARIRTYTP